MVVWFPAYFHVWGWANLLHLCDVAVILSFVGIWWANPLLLSSQAVSSLAAGLFWILDVGWRLDDGTFSHRWHGLHVGRTFSALGAPALVLSRRPATGPSLDLASCRLRQTRSVAYKPQSPPFFLIVSRFLSAEINMNYAYRDPVFHRAWGPAPVHLASRVHYHRRSGLLAHASAAQLDFSGARTVKVKEKPLVEKKSFIASNSASRNRFSSSCNIARPDLRNFHRHCHFAARRPYRRPASESACHEGCLCRFERPGRPDPSCWQMARRPTC